MSEKREAYEYRSADLREARGSNPANVASVELLQKRVARLEARMDFSEVVTDVIADAHVSGNSREYYEQQIEEMSAKWQAAEEKYKRAEINNQNALRTLDLCEKDICDQAQKIMGLLQVKGELVEVIADLREKIGSRDAVIADKNRELEVMNSLRNEEVMEYASVLTSQTEDAKLGALVRSMELKEFPLETCAKILECITGAKTTYEGKDL